MAGPEHYRRAEELTAEAHKLLGQGDGQATASAWAALAQTHAVLALAAIAVGVSSARYSPHDNPAERIWAALKNYMANTAVSWPGRPWQIHCFFRNRSPDQMLATAAPWTSPWLPPRYDMPAVALRNREEC